MENKTGVCYEHGKVMLRGLPCRECRERELDKITATIHKEDTPDEIMQELLDIINEFK